MGRTEVRIEPARAEHIALLAPVTREPDRQEVWASSRSTPEQALVRGLSVSSQAWTVFFDDEVAAMWGVAPVSLLSDTGAPWLLSSPAVDRHPLAFLRHSRALVDDLHEGYAVLRNYVDARYTVCIRWLRGLGFTIGPAIPVGVDGMPFHPFERETADV